jgi:hypothetical protein
MEMQKYCFDLDSLPNGVFTLIPLGDIQYDGSSESTALRLLKETIQRGVEAEAFYIGMGDYTDFLSPSNRDRLRSAALYDTANDVIERTGEALINEIHEILRPTAGRWLGLLEGHHFQEFSDGTTSDMRLAAMLRTHHLGTSAFVGLTFKRGRSSLLVNLWAQHGEGNGQSPSAPITKLDKVVQAFEADLYLLGHMTKLAHAPINRIYPAWGGKEPDVYHRDIHLVGTGGFSRAIQIGKRAGLVPRGSYVEQAMMRPVSLGAPIIRIKIERSTKGGRDLLQRRITVEI